MDSVGFAGGLEVCIEGFEIWQRISKDFDICQRMFTQMIYG